MNSLSSLITGGTTGFLLLVAVSFAAFVLFVVPYQIYKQQQGLIAERDGEIASLKKSVEKKDELLEAKQPKLTGEIEGYVTAIMSNDVIEAVPYIAFRVMVRNTGAPSITDDWTLQMQDRDGKIIHGVPMFADPNGKVPLFKPDENTPFAKAHLQITGEKLLSKRNPDPIPSGGALLGWAAFVFPELTAKDWEKTERIDNVTFVLEISDVSEKRIRCHFDQRIRNLDNLPPGYTPQY